MNECKEKRWTYVLAWLQKAHTTKLTKTQSKIKVKTSQIAS